MVEGPNLVSSSELCTLKETRDVRPPKKVLNSGHQKMTQFNLRAGRDGGQCNCYGLCAEGGAYVKA